MEKKLNVHLCKAMFGSLEKLFSLDINPEHFTDLDSIDRGGVMFHSNFLFNIILCGYSIFNLCISKELESRFISVEYQKHTLVVTMEHYIVNTDKYNGLLLSVICVKLKSL